MNLSLRARLVIIILLPLLIIAAIVGTLAVYDAKSRATERFDRSLLSSLLAVSRDVALSGGDALSPATDALLRDASGGQVFYHVYAPDGVFVTGYATPPVPIGAPRTQDLTFFEGSHLNRPVRVLRFTDVMQIDALTGPFTFTVWQDVALRSDAASELFWRTFAIIASLVATVALVIWFGVRFGLRPLNELEDAIGRRSSDDLDPIRRAVPVEAAGIVQTVNGLLGQVSSSLKAKDEFISNAAHQLRNPIAGVTSMSEAVVNARSFEDMKTRSAELLIAARKTSDLAQKLLTYERAQGSDMATTATLFDLETLIGDIAGEYTGKMRAENLRFNYSAPDRAVAFSGDETLLEEAVKNLLDNAVLHGGPQLWRVSLALFVTPGFVAITVQDDGLGMSKADIPRALERFGQLSPSVGSGLGLSIAHAAATHHGGSLSLTPLNPGLCVELRLPLV